MDTRFETVIVKGWFGHFDLPKPLCVWSLRSLQSNRSGTLNNSSPTQVVNPKQNGSSVPAPYEALPGFRDKRTSSAQTLLELVDYVTSANGKFTETVMQEAIKMVLVVLLCAFNVGYLPFDIFRVEALNVIVAHFFYHHSSTAGFFQLGFYGSKAFLAFAIRFSFASCLSIVDYGIELVHD
ncbi:hypothetical protein POTOM_030411 [Populus tomentosa]|uniref:Uncharacterized protein n=1 Tax=Populus tomentosa TaxID=118781 RepID=A0A8X7ZAS4_POPTO|nr:hypothetical protein POTOM_030411 [Populus tomentosa]